MNTKQEIDDEVCAIMKVHGFNGQVDGHEFLTALVLRCVAVECERLRRALHEIAEEWAGAECGEPVYSQEAYAIGLAKRMYALSVEGLTPNARLSGRQRP